VGQRSAKAIREKNLIKYQGRRKKKKEGEEKSSVS
jgi:hypothetical protein